LLIKRLFLDPQAQLQRSAIHFLKYTNGKRTDNFVRRESSVVSGKWQIDYVG